LTDEFNADPSRPWDSTLSERHQRIDEELDSKLEDFYNEEKNNPVAVVGPYGAGKTQYLYEVLRRGWSRDIPALYTDLRTILHAHEETDEPIVEWLENKTKTEIERLEKGERSDWIPEFRYSDREDEFYEEFIEDSEISTEKRILLIDEVEQKYEELYEHMDVDDTNPLREILDNLTDVFQVWSFGLVSAYELTGEADRRRFDEVRIPITDVDTVWEQLKRNKKPPSISNGVWWISRGRAGWISNHSSDLPNNPSWTGEEFEEWVDEASNHTYYGADSVTAVWGQKEVPAAEIRNAKRTVLFESPAYDDWTIESSNAIIEVSKAHEVLLEAIRDQQAIEGDVFEIIRSNLLDVLEGLSPPSAWVTDGDEVKKMFLPGTAFSRSDNMEGLMNTVRDFISSFEKRGDKRKEATRVLGKLNIDSLSNEWSGLLDPFEKVEEYDVDVWTVKAPIVRDAYKPLALNPETLTNKETLELRNSITSPLPFDPQIPIDGANLEVQLCPTEKAFNSLCKRLAEKSNIMEATVVVVPDVERFNADFPPHVKHLIEHDLVSIEEVGGERLWDFVIQLDHYLDSRDYSEKLRKELIQDTVIPNVEEDQIRNTINALFNELEHLVTKTAASARTSYLDAYTLQDIDELIWKDDDLIGDTPYYGTTSSSDTPKHGLEYGLVFSERTIDSDVPHKQLISSLHRAYNNDYTISGKRWFRSSYFFNQSFEGDGEGISNKVQKIRNKYVTEDGQLRRPIRRLQKALVYLCELNGEGVDRVYERVVHINSTNYDEEEELQVLRDSTMGNPQTEDLFRGILLRWSLESNSTLLKNDLKSASEDLQILDKKMDKVSKQVEELNKKFKPPADVDVQEHIQLQESKISEYHKNITSVYTGVNNLIDVVEEHPNVAPAVAVLWSIVDRYIPMMEDVVDEFRNQLGNVELFENILNLKGEYNELRQWSNRAEGLEPTQVKEDQVQRLVNDLGEIIFDFPTRLGTDDVPIEQDNLINKLDSLVRDDINQLSQLNQRTDEIENELESTEELAEAISESLQEFAASTSAPGGQQ
jgi:hypothetical protein